MDRILKYGLNFFLIGIGVVIGIAIRHYNSIPLAETINIIDVATLVTTIFLAVYIPEVLDRKLQKKRDKKIIIGQRVDELQTLYRRMDFIVQQETCSIKDMIILRNTLDIAQHRLDTIISLLNFANMKTSFEKEIRAIKRLTKEHKELLWFDGMEEKEYQYTDAIKENEELLYNKIDRETCLLVFKISDVS